MAEDMSDALALLGREVLLRPGPAFSYVNGRSTLGSALPEVTITAVVYPASGREVQRLPEGYREAEAITLCTAYALRGASPGRAGDVVVDGGGEYEAQIVEPWGPLGGFVRAICARKAAQ